MRISGGSRLRRTVPTVVVLTSAVALLSVAPAVAAPPKVRHAEGLLLVPNGSTKFSPNGDGSQDRTGFSYRPTRRATVQVTVRDARGTVVRAANLGKQTRGEHYWTWNGRNRHGTYVHDGAYRVTFTATATATRHGKRLRDSDTSRAVARTRFDMSPNGVAFTPEVYLDRDAIYRDTTYFKDEFNWVGAEYVTKGDGSPESRGASRITGPDGEVVFEHGGDWFQPRQPWDGTDQDGVRVPAGTYTLVNTWKDLYGNHLSVTKPLVVADGSRVEQHHSITVTPAEARVGTATEPYEFDDDGRFGTHVSYACPPRASDRFPAGGLSFVLYDPRCTASNDTFKVALPVDLDLTFDTIKLTAVGGPTTAGGDGSAELGLTLFTPPARTAAGDEATTVVQTTRGQFQPPADDVSWYVRRETGGYDVKSFTVDIYHYEPPA